MFQRSSKILKTFGRQMMAVLSYLRECFSRIFLFQWIYAMFKIFGFVKHDNFPPLSSEAENLIAKAWNRYYIDDDKVFVETPTVKITRKDLKTLSGMNWLNDEVINFYLGLIVRRSKRDKALPKVYAFQTFFYNRLIKDGYAAVQRWTKNIDLFVYDLLIVPIHLTNHWCLTVIDIKNRRLEYYDSLHGTNYQALQTLSSYLFAELQDKNKNYLRINEWDFIFQRDVPMQQNGCDCGVFTCKFAEYASRKATIDFSQNHMQYFRKRMVWEICQQKLM